ncbi:hypothetical protein QUA71_12530 [Microcoleus sp. MON1_C5]
MEMRSHLDALRKFDRTWSHYGNSIARFRLDRTDKPNRSIAGS